MRPKVITLTGTGSGASETSPVRVDSYSDRTGLGLQTNGSTTGFTVEYTRTSPAGYASASAWATAAAWTASSISGASADANDVVAGPVHGVRLKADASGTDTGTLTISQEA